MAIVPLQIEDFESLGANGIRVRTGGEQEANRRRLGHGASINLDVLDFYLLALINWASQPSRSDAAAERLGMVCVDLTLPVRSVK